MTWTVTVDLDGTLLRAPFWNLHLRPFLAEAARKRGTTVRKLWAPVREAGEARWRRGDWAGSFAWGDLLRARWNLALPDAAVPPPGALAPLFMHRLAEALPRLAALPLRYVVVTNGYRAYQRPYVTALGMASGLVTPDQTGVAKPDPRVFDGLGRILCHVGDRPGHDTLAARRRGLVAVQLGAPEPEQERMDRLAAAVPPTHQVGDWIEAAALFERMLQERTVRLYQIGAPATSDDRRGSRPAHAPSRQTLRGRR